MRPNISTGVSAVGEQRPTNNQIPYRPNCCRSSGEMLSGTKPLGVYAVPAVDPLLPFFLLSTDSLPGSKFNGLASLSRLITHSTMCICISASICQAGAKLCDQINWDQMPANNRIRYQRQRVLVKYCAKDVHDIREGNVTLPEL
uniref:Uncharacterized protein n=1 Tax=Glossina austeni TaxID=7395 RepID=A0A1A9VEX1_GLOAU